MSKFPNHINSIYLSDIYEEIIHQFSYVGLVLRHKQFCFHAGLATVDSPHINSESFPSQHGTLTECWFNVANIQRLIIIIDAVTTLERHWASSRMASHIVSHYTTGNQLRCLVLGVSSVRHVCHPGVEWDHT